MSSKAKAKKPVLKQENPVLTPKNAEQENYIRTIVESTITIIDSPPGVGKTVIPVFLAVQALRAGTINKIIITRPAVSSDEDLGYLKGGLEEKMYVYMIPIFDELNKFATKAEIEYWKTNNMLEVAPLGFMRGRTFIKTFIIADELQNATYGQIKMLTTRLGFGSKMVLNGDSDQSDLPLNKRGALNIFADILGETPGVGVCSMTIAVRHPIIGHILAAINKYEKNQQPK